MVAFNRLKQCFEVTFAEAIILLTLNKFKENVIDNYKNRCVIYIKQGDYDKAWNDINKVMDLVPNDAENFFNRGCLYQSIDDILNALNDFKRSIQLDNSYPDPHLYRALLYEGQKKYKKAIRDFERYLRKGGGEKFGNRGLIQSKIAELNALL